MAFTERQEYKVEIIPPYNFVQVRRADIILKDGVEVGRTYHRHCLNPGDDVSNECDTVKAIAPQVWTADIISAYEATLPEEEEEEVSTMPSPEEEEVSTMPSPEEEEVGTMPAPEENDDDTTN